MRHKQCTPKRKRVDHDFLEWDQAEARVGAPDQQQQGQHQAVPKPQRPMHNVTRAEPEPEQPYCAVEEFDVAAAPQAAAVGAIAELIVATKAAGPTPAGAAPVTVNIQLHHKQHVGYGPRPQPVLLMSWRCPEEAAVGPKHEVCCELPSAGCSSILAQLQQGHLSITVQQLPQQQSSTASSSSGLTSQQHTMQQQQQQLPLFQGAAARLLAPVQFATLTANSDYVREFECDVVMLPEPTAVQAGVKQCCLLAAAAARAAGGPTASLAQQSHVLLEALAPRLPAQHVSLMAAVTAPALLQEHAQQQQQQQQQQSVDLAGGDDRDMVGAAGAGPGGVGSEGDPPAAPALTLWRVQFFVQQTAVAGATVGSAEQLDQQQQQQLSMDPADLQAAISWLVPHWSSKASQGQWDAVFDAAEVYRVTKPSGLEVQLQGNPAGLIPKLRPYQRRAVAWMLGLELGQHASAGEAQAASMHSSGVQQMLAGLLHPFSEWQTALLLPAVPPCQLACNSSSSSSDTCIPATTTVGASSLSRSSTNHHEGSEGGADSGAGAQLMDPPALQQLYLHPPSGQLSAVAPQTPPVVPGGVLADEMGLGKTVELLSLIVTNRFRPTAADQPNQQPQEQLHTGPLPGHQPQLSRRSSSATGGKCCSRCGESFKVRYTKEGKIAQEAWSHAGGDDSAACDTDDADDYTPRHRSKSGKGKQQGGRGTKRTARQQQLPPLAPHGAGHHGSKRQRVAAKQHHDVQDGADAGGGVLCSLCMREMALQEVDQDCRTTLIVVPANILVQWVDELQRHTLPGSLSIKVYSGQPQAATQPSKAGRSRSSSPAAGSNVRGAAAATAASGKAAASNEVVMASQLAAADIVLTSYDIIRREVALQPQTEGAPDRSLRHRKRYAVVPTPLTRLVFWRLVMDEAQLAGGTSKAAEMAQHIKARHRWAVTGTPISHGGRADLLGLLKFLQVPHIPQGVGHLLRLLCPGTGGVMWRTAKADVAGEMGIPPQHHHTTVLRLSAIERHWYNRSHQECAAKARKVLQEALEGYIMSRDLPRCRRTAGDAAVAAAKAAAKRVAAAVIAAGGDESQLDDASAALLELELAPSQLKKLLLPLLRLRQACCHPQVGASGIRGIISGHNSSKPLTMDQILSVLISRARVDAEEAQRQLAGALNGLAALSWLAQQHPDAVAAYREVLTLSEASKGDVRLDKFQLLHTLHNLAELLQELARKQQQPRHTAQQQDQQQQQQQQAAAAASCLEPYGSNVTRTLRDESLSAEASAIREQYLAQRQAELATAHQTYVKAAADALPAGLRHHKQRHAAAAGSSHGGSHTAGLLDEVLPDLLHGEEEAGSSDDGADGDGDDGSEGSSGWYIRVIDALKEAGMDEEVADVIRMKLQEGDTYRREVGKNATSMANRFKSLGGLKLLLSQELSAISQHQATCLTTLQQLQGAVSAASGPDELVVEQAAQCGRCRSEMGVLGRVCRHCKLDEAMRTWEARLFQLQTRALAAGMQLDASVAARQAQAAAYRRVVGRGGLNEQAAEDLEGTEGGADGAAGGFGDVVGPSAGAGARRTAAQVSEAQVVRHPCEAEVVLRLLQQHIGKLGMASYLPGIQDSASQHLSQLEGSRKLFVAANSLSIAQRQLLYAHDELAMAVLRITSRREGEQVTDHEALYKLTPAEQVLKKEELSLDKAVAAGDLRRAMGTLNYLKTIAGARSRLAAVTAAAAGGAGAGGGSTAAGQSASAEAAAQAQTAPKPADPRAAAAAAALQRAAAAAAAGHSSTPDTAQAGEQHNKQDQEQAQQDREEAQQVSGDPQLQTADPAPGNGSAAAGTAAAAPEEKCPICFAPVEAAAAVLPCGHVLCCACADALVERIPPGTAPAHRHISCPSCRSRTHISDVAYVNSEQSSKHAYVHTTSTVAAVGAPAAAALGSGQALASTVGDSAAASAGADADYPFKAEQQLVLAGSYGTKIEAVVRRVLFVLQQDPSNKVLVFSSWSDVLSIVSHALADNGVLHAFAKDRKGLLQALELFKGCQVSAAELGRAASGGTTAATAGVAGQSGTDKVNSSSSRASSSTRLATESSPDSSLQMQQEQEKHPQGLDGLDGVDAEGDSYCDAAGAAADDSQQQKQQGMPESAVLLPAAAAAAAGAGAAGMVGVRETRVLLLLVSQGGLGLNLTEAQHVVLLEPLLDPALDVQAVGRVSRFGQKRHTHVHRFIVQDTVEENVARLSRERAAAMDMTAAVPAKGGSGGAAETTQLTVREVAALVCSRWRDGRDA